MERVLIVGNGYAGLAAAKVLSSEKGLSVTMVSAETCPAYVPHLLPELAAGKKTEGDLYLLDPGGCAGRNVAFRPGAGVVKLSAKKRSALLSTGETVEFDKALIATGASAWIPGELKDVKERCANILAMKRIADARALRELLAKGATRVAIVGAGRVGMLLAEALKETGVSVSVVEIGPQVLATMLEEDVAGRLRPILAKRRYLSLHTGTRIAGIECEGAAAREIRLSDGTIVPCDAVVIATGVEANTGFLEGDFPSTAEGLEVGDMMETREPGIHAAGDVVRFATISGKTGSRPLAMNARIQGETAARNIAGQKTACPPSFSGNVVRLDPFIAARIGEIGGSGRADFTVGKSFARATVEGQAVIGIQFVGDPEDMRGLVTAVLKKFPVSEIPGLSGGRLDFGIVPLVAARSAAWA